MLFVSRTPHSCGYCPRAECVRLNYTCSFNPLGFDHQNPPITVMHSSPPPITGLWTGMHHCYRGILMHSSPQIKNPPITVMHSSPQTYSTQQIALQLLPRRPAATALRQRRRCRSGEKVDVVCNGAYLTCSPRVAKILPPPVNLSEHPPVILPPTVRPRSWPKRSRSWPKRSTSWRSRNIMRPWRTATIPTRRSRRGF